MNQVSSRYRSKRGTEFDKNSPNLTEDIDFEIGPSWLGLKVLKNTKFRIECHDLFPMLSHPLITTTGSIDITSPTPLGPIQLN